MFRGLFSISTVALILAAGTASAEFIDGTKTISTTTETFMGMSSNSPPNDNAASSKGARTEETTTSIHVYGPPGQVNGYVNGTFSTCGGACVTDDPETTTVITGPGAN